MFYQSIEIFNNSFITLFFNEEAKNIDVIWSNKASQTTTDEFKEQLRIFVKCIKDYQAKSFLVDSRAGHIIIDLDIQEWHDKEIVPHYIEAGIQKIAFVVPPNITEQVSIEQTFEEQQAQALQTRHFDDIDIARRWIYTKSGDLVTSSQN